MLNTPEHDIAIDLSAVIVTVANGAPLVMVMPDMSLPSGPFSLRHRTLEQGLRSWVRDRCGLELGYVEQLYTFADSDRIADGRKVSIGYLALTRESAVTPGKMPGQPAWKSWYDFFPWEDRRFVGSRETEKTARDLLKEWCGKAGEASETARRRQRVETAFPRNSGQWNEEMVLQRYELLWEAGLVAEASPTGSCQTGQPMALDHRRILATGMARLRAKIKYRPVVFELMPDSFTLLQLQETVEALAGLRLRKQNFRRLVQGQGLVEQTGSLSGTARGRPARLFSFRREVLGERALSGTRLPRMD